MNDCMNSNEQILFEYMKSKLRNGTLNTAVHENEVIRSAFDNGYTRVVEMLLKDGRVNPADMDNYAICMASKNGHTRVVKLLLEDERVDPTARYNFAIREASAKGHAEVVRLLLTKSLTNPADMDNLAIREASAKGHTEVVKLLLNDKQVDPSDLDNYAICTASTNGHTEVVKILFQSSKKVRAFMKTQNPTLFREQMEDINTRISVLAIKILLILNKKQYMVGVLESLHENIIFEHVLHIMTDRTNDGRKFIIQEFKKAV